MGKRWPVHPVPLPEETLSSWVTRVARANAAKPSSWFAVLEGRYRNLAFADLFKDAGLWNEMLEGTGLTGGKPRLRAMIFEDAGAWIGYYTADRWLLSADERVDQGKHRYCPGCLRDDPIPYLRRAWRFEWVYWCPTHDVPLIDRCSGCQAVVQPWRLRWDRPFGSCWSCGHDLTATPADAGSPRHAPAFVRRAVTESLTMALAESRPNAKTESPFAAVWCLQKWAEAVGIERWPAFLKAAGCKPSERVDDAPPDERAAWSFALAWHLATGPRLALEALVQAHRATFNRATTTRCPPSLASLRQLVHPRVTLTPASVTTAIENLLAKGVPVTYAAVADSLAVSSKRIADHELYRGFVDAAEPKSMGRWCDGMRERLLASRARLQARGERVSRAQLAADAGVSIEAIARFEKASRECIVVAPEEDYEPRVRRAVEALKKAEKRVTEKAVAEILGRDRSVFDRHAKLKAIVREARDSCPAADVLEQACKHFDATRASMTVVGLAQYLGCGRHHLERNKALRTIVAHYQRYEGFHTENDASNAAKRLGTAGKPITFASICREMKRHRSFVEKQPLLRKLVERLADSSKN